MKKILILLSALMIFSFGACGEKDSKEEEDTRTEVLKESGEKEIETKETESESAEQEVSNLPEFDYLFTNREPIEFGVIEELLDPATIYAKVKYTSEMFYGHYELVNEKEQIENYKVEMEYMDYAGSRFGKITSIPYEIEIGPKNFKHMIRYVPGYDWARLYYINGGGHMEEVMASYTVEGNLVKFTPVEEYSYDNEKNKISYRLSDITWEYEFSFKGPDLTLSRNGKSVTMSAYDFLDDNTLRVSHYLTENSAQPEGIDGIDFSEYGNTITILKSNGRHCYDVIGGMTNDGLFVISWIDESGVTHTRQFVYFYCERDGIILSDASSNYYFNSDYSDRYTKKLIDNVTIEDMEALEKLSEQKLQEIIEKKANLLADLAAAYEAVGMDVQINEETGEIELDSTILFGVNEFEVSPEGKEFLKQFVGIYTSVVFDEKYEGFVSTIMIEGHTDTNGSYERNLQLSQDRADSVKGFCTSAESGLDVADIEALTTSAKAVGYSYDKPVYDANGNVDMDASRRVSFRFIINLDE